MIGLLTLIVANGWLTYAIPNSSPRMYMYYLFVCVKVLRPSQSNGLMSSAVSLSNHTFTGQD